ncbi:hypothetical protein MKJ04_02645, partial [Pontibacter sp. E15-1]|uniref:hypothetical protein n=1 Tax=Pontibacter sp. E15-1 TaxID=2919918 RepID=UPI001F4F28BF
PKEDSRCHQRGVSAKGAWLLVSQPFFFLPLEPTTQLELKYYKIIEDSFDENGNPIRETDLTEIDEKILKFFNQEAMVIRNGEANFDIRLEPIAELISNLRKQIFFVKQRAIEFSESIECQHKNLIIDDGENKSYVTLINDIHTSLEIELNKVLIEE